MTTAPPRFIERKYLNFFLHFEQYAVNFDNQVGLHVAVREALYKCAENIKF